MKEFALMIIIVSLFAFASFKIYGFLLKAKAFYFFVISIVYLGATYFYFEVINYTINTLAMHKIYFEFGHASIELLALLALCLLIASVNIIFVIIKRLNYTNSKSG